MNTDPPEDLRTRTRRFAHLSVRLPRTPHAQVIARQILKSGTSVGAHYREGCRARSEAEFISKLEGGLQELDETAYWCELLIDSKFADWPLTHQILSESDELIRIFVAIVKKRKDQ